MGVFGDADSISGLKNSIRGNPDPYRSLEDTSQRSNPRKITKDPVFLTKPTQICPRCHSIGFKDTELISKLKNKVRSQVDQLR